MATPVLDYTIFLSFLASGACLFCRVFKIRRKILTKGATFQFSVKGNQNLFRNLFHPAQAHTGNCYFMSLVVCIIFLLEQTNPMHKLLSCNSYNKKNKADPSVDNICPAKISFALRDGSIFVVGGLTTPHTPSIASAAGAPT